MKKIELNGESKLKKRERKISNILILSGVLGVISGMIFSQSMAANKTIPLSLAIIMTIVILGLTVYYFSLRDEYQKHRDYKHHTFGVLMAAGIMIPWYVAGEQNILPKPHVLITFLIIFIPTYVMTIISWFAKDKADATS